MVLESITITKLMTSVMIEIYSQYFWKHPCEAPQLQLTVVKPQIVSHYISAIETSPTNGHFGGKYLPDLNYNDTTITVWFLAFYRRRFHNYISFELTEKSLMKERKVG